MARKWTEEEKKAASEKAKARRAQMLAEQAAVVTTQNDPVEAQALTPEPKVTNSPETPSDELLRQAIEAISMLAQLQAANGGANNGPQVRNGKLTGTVEKYAVDPSLYPDPSDRLREEPRLQRFGFKENFDLRWTVTTTEYTTIDNIRMREPKFILDLVRVVFDEETGIPTGGRYVEYRLISHEDPDSSLMVARANHINVDDYDERDFLNEMRYIKMRDWIMSCFYKAKPGSNTNRREMVINGKVVEYFEVNSEDSAKIPFDNLGTKL